MGGKVVAPLKTSHIAEGYLSIMLQALVLACVRIAESFHGMWVHTNAGMPIYCFMVYESNSLVMNMQRVTASNLGWSHLVLGLKANPSI